MSYFGSIFITHCGSVSRATLGQHSSCFVALSHELRWVSIRHALELCLMLVFLHDTTTPVIFRIADYHRGYHIDIQPHQGLYVDRIFPCFIAKGVGPGPYRSRQPRLVACVYLPNIVKYYHLCCSLLIKHVQCNIVSAFCLYLDC
jgi:hypothetical protein